MTRNSQKTATSQNEQVPADQVPTASTSNITKELQVVITEKDMVQPAKPKKQTAHRGKKYTGVKPANVGNRPLTLNEQKKTHIVDQEIAVDHNAIEDCHIQTRDSLYGDWLIQQGIPNPKDVTLDPLVIDATQKESQPDIHKKMGLEDITVGQLHKVQSMVPGGSDFLEKLGEYILSDDDIDTCQKRVEHLKNIIWLIEKKPADSKMPEDVPQDNSKLEF